MRDMKEKINSEILKKGWAQFTEITALFPEHSMVYVAEMLHEMAGAGELSKKTDIETGASCYFKRFYTRSGSHIVFHYKDHAHPEKFVTEFLIEDMPWFFEPIELNSDMVFSINFADYNRAIEAAEREEISKV